MPSKESKETPAFLFGFPWFCLDLFAGNSGLGCIRPSKDYGVTLLHRLHGRLFDMSPGVLVLLDALCLCARLSGRFGQLVHLLMIVIIGGPQRLVGIVLGVGIAFEPARPEVDLGEHRQDPAVSDDLPAPVAGVE